MLALAAAALLAAQPAPKIAVLDLESTGVPDTLVQTLSLLLPNAVRDAAPGKEILASGDIRSMIGFERQRQLLGCKEDSACMSEIGGALGVGELVGGSLGKVGKSYVLQLRRLDMSRGRTIATDVETVDGGEDALLSAVRRGVRKLFAGTAPPEPSGQVAYTSMGRLDTPRWPGWALTVGGGVVLLAGLITTGITIANYTSLKNLYEVRNNSQADYQNYLTAYQANANAIKGQGKFADYTIVGGALVGAAGVVWLLRTTSPAPSVSLTVGPGQVGLSGSF